MYVSCGSCLAGIFDILSFNLQPEIGKHVAGLKCFVVTDNRPFLRGYEIMPRTYPLDWERFEMAENWHVVHEHFTIIALVIFYWF